MDPVPFSSLLPQYRAVLFDSYGVLRSSAAVFPGVPELLARLSDSWVVTNDASRSAAKIAEPFGIDPERVVSSGSAASAYLSDRHRGARAAYLGPPECAHWLTIAGLEARPLPEIGDDELAGIELFAVMDDRGFDWERDLNRVVNLLRDRPNLPFILPNPDLIFPAREGRVGIASGGLTALLEATTGAVARRFGKPGPAIFERALKLAREAIDPLLEPHEVLMVGDTLATDIAGAQRLEIRTALVLSGNTTAEGLDAALADAGITPDHVVTSILD